MSQASQKYWKISLSYPIEIRDELDGFFWLNDSQGVEEHDVGAHGRAPLLLQLDVYFPFECDIENIKTELATQFPSVIINDVSTFDRSQIVFNPFPFEPFELIKNVWILPSPELVSPHPQGEKESIDSANIQITIRPGMAFGTGRHESTAVATELLKRVGHKDTRMIDVGAGSGILSFFAKKIGVQKIHAVEIDPVAHENFRENCALNGFDDIVLFTNSEEAHPPYDIVVANIEAPVLLAIQKQLKDLMSSDGFLVLSGMTDSREKDVLNAYLSDSKLKVLHRHQIGEWVGLILTPDQ